MRSDCFDGNAIGGMLLDVFGSEMTAARCTCASCGATAAIAELDVYLRSPGTVVRCGNCAAVLMVFVAARGQVCVDLSGLASLGADDAQP